MLESVSLGVRAGILSTRYTQKRASQPLFGFSSGRYDASMHPQYSARLGRLPSKFHNEIRRYRLQRGLTQEALARQLGIRIATISSWERGRTCPAIPIVFRLARLLDTSAEGLYPDFYLLTGPETVTAQVA